MPHHDETPNPDSTARLPDPEPEDVARSERLMPTIGAVLAEEGELLQLGVRARARIAARPLGEYPGFSALLAECLPQDSGRLELVARAIHLPALTLADLAEGGNVASELIPEPMAGLARAIGPERETFLSLAERDAARQAAQDQAAGLSPYDPAFLEESLRDLGDAYDRAAYQEGAPAGEA